MVTISLLYCIFATLAKHSLPDHHLSNQNPNKEHQVPEIYLGDIKIVTNALRSYLLRDLSMEENLFLVIFELRLIFVCVPA